MWVPPILQWADTGLLMASSIALPLRPCRVLMLCFCWQPAYCTVLGARSAPTEAHASDERRWMPFGSLKTLTWECLPGPCELHMMAHAA